MDLGVVLQKLVYCPPQDVMDDDAHDGDDEGGGDGDHDGGEHFH